MIDWLDQLRSSLDQTLRRVLAGARRARTGLPTLAGTVAMSEGVSSGTYAVPCAARRARMLAAAARQSTSLQSPVGHERAYPGGV